MNICKLIREQIDILPAHAYPETLLNKHQDKIDVTKEYLANENHQFWRKLNEFCTKYIFMYNHKCTHTSLSVGARVCRRLC